MARPHTGIKPGMSLRINPSAAAKFVSNAARTKAPVFSAFQQFCDRTGEDAGGIVRVRWSTLYSTVSLSYGAGGVPALDSTRLYQQTLGSTDAVMGTMTDRETNINSAGKMANGQSFRATAHGFDVFLHTQAAAPVLPDAIENAILDFVTHGTCKLITGSETQQIWGPLTPYMVGTYGVTRGASPTQAAGSAAVSGGGVTGWSPRTWVDLDPFVILEPGQSFAVEVNTRGLMTTIAANAGLVLGIRHWFAGQTRTEVDG